MINKSIKTTQQKQYKIPVSSAEPFHVTEHK